MSLIFNVFEIETVKEGNTTLHLHIFDAWGPSGVKKAGALLNGFNASTKSHKSHHQCATLCFIGVFFGSVKKLYSYTSNHFSVMVDRDRSLFGIKEAFSCLRCEKYLGF